MKDKLALVIGCGYAHNELISLSGTVNDANNMDNFLTKRGYNVTNMNDDEYKQDNILYPNKKNILSQMKKLLITAVNRKIYNCVIYFAGHGIQDEFNDNPDEVDRKDECIIPSSFDIKNPDTAIKDDEINVILNDTIKYESKMNLFMMFDCCHSATNADLKYTYDYNGVLNHPPKLTFDTDIDASIIKLSGCLDSKTSLETIINGQSQGLLTSSFIDCINKDNTLIQDIFLISKKIYTYTKKYGQSPQVSASLDLNDYNNSRSILNHTVSISNYIVTDNESCISVNDELNNMDINTLFHNNVIKKVPSYRIDLFGPMASTFSKIQDLQYKTHTQNTYISNTNTRMNMNNNINNVDVSSIGLIKYLV
jgi:hypothetical protein